jgi:hypothetical protein
VSKDNEPKLVKDYINETAVKKDLIKDILPDENDKILPPLKGMTPAMQKKYFGLNTAQVEVPTSFKLNDRTPGTVASLKVTEVAYKDKEGRFQAYDNARELRELGAEYHAVNKTTALSGDKPIVGTKAVEIAEKTKLSSQKISGIVKDINNIRPTSYHRILDTFKEGIHTQRQFNDVISHTKSVDKTVQSPENLVILRDEPKPGRSDLNYALKRQGKFSEIADKPLPSIPPATPTAKADVKTQKKDSPPIPKNVKGFGKTGLLTQAEAKAGAKQKGSKSPAKNYAIEDTFLSAMSKAGNELNKARTALAHNNAKTKPGNSLKPPASTPKSNDAKKGPGLGK